MIDSIRSKVVALPILLCSATVLAQDVDTSCDLENRVPLFFSDSGVVKSVTYHRNDRVQAGAIIASLDDTALKAERRALAAETRAKRLAYRIQQQAHERQKELYDEGSLSAVDLQKGEHASLQAKADLLAVEVASAQVELRLQQSHLISPVSGRVLHGLVVGQAVNAAQGTSVLVCRGAE